MLNIIYNTSNSDIIRDITINNKGDFYKCKIKF